MVDAKGVSRSLSIGILTGVGSVYAFALDDTTDSRRQLNSI